MEREKGWKGKETGGRRTSPGNRKEPMENRGERQTGRRLRGRRDGGSRQETRRRAGTQQGGVHGRGGNQPQGRGKSRKGEVGRRHEPLLRPHGPPFPTH